MSSYRCHPAVYELSAQTLLHMDPRMDAGLRQVLQTNREEAGIYIQLDYLLPGLLTKKLVTESEFRKLSADDNKRTRDEKNKELLRLIETKGGEKSFDLFVQTLEAEKQHTGHEHLAGILKKAKANLKARLIRQNEPPRPPPKPAKKLDSTQPPLSGHDYSLLIDQMTQINRRLANLEKDVQEIKQKVLDTSFERKVNLAMEELNDKVYALKDLIAESQHNDADYKKPIPVSSDYEDVRSEIDGIVSNDNVYTEVKSQPKNPVVADKSYPPEAYMTLQKDTVDHTEKHYQKPLPQIRFNQDDYVETNLLKKGNSGEFWLAVSKTDDTKVVIKKPTECTTEILGQELHVLTCCHHPNIIQLISPILSQQIPSLVFKYAEKGQLKEYLQNEKDSLNESSLLAMAASVACGMAELEHRGFIHCDLKASNILIDNDKICKIASFNKVLCLKGNEKYKICNTNRLAIRWQAPEVLSDNKFSSKSDVWSFGVFLSELFTYGEKPYPDMKADDVRQFVLNKNKMSLPSGCPKEVYKLMTWCFDANVEKRPTFDVLNKRLKKLQSKLYRTPSSDPEEYT